MAKKRVAKQEPVSDLAILHPDRPVEIAGRSIVVREYGFIEGQRLLHLAEPLIKEIANAFAGGVPAFIEFQFIAAKYIDNLTKLISVSIDQPEEWLEGLSPIDGDLLLNIWWEVNGNFYIRSAAQIAEIQKKMTP